MSGKKFVFLEEEKPVLLPLWREALTGVDWLRLRTRPVYYGVGVPKGDGAAVITVPGFLGHDVYLREMNFWLKRIGYKAYGSNIGHNAECPDILIDRLLLTLQKACNETGRPAHFIGHSLGGILSRAAAVLAPEQVASVITLGAPFRGIHSHPSVMQTSRIVRKRIEARRHTRPANKPLRQACFTMNCNCAFADAVRMGLPGHVRETAIYTKTDGVVDWQVCISGVPSQDFEVAGTHCGLAWNHDAYAIIARRLTLPIGSVTSKCAPPAPQKAMDLV